MFNANTLSFEPDMTAIYRITEYKFEFPSVDTSKDYNSLVIIKEKIFFYNEKQLLYDVSVNGELIYENTEIENIPDRIIQMIGMSNRYITRHIFNE